MQEAANVQTPTKVSVDTLTALFFTTTSLIILSTTIQYYELSVSMPTAVWPSLMTRWTLWDLQQAL